MNPQITQIAQRENEWIQNHKSETQIWKSS